MNEVATTRLDEGRIFLYYAGREVTSWRFTDDNHLAARAVRDTLNVLEDRLEWIEDRLNELEEKS